MKFSENFAGTEPLPSSIGAINRLPEAEKRRVYLRVVPPRLLERFGLNPYLVDTEGRSLLTLRAPAGAATVELAVYHRYGFPDPVLYAHLGDSLSGQLHVLLYILNDPEAPRFDVDRLPDGRPTRFGILARHVAAERAALQAGLAPGQIRRGLRMLPAAIATFEAFAAAMGQRMYFAEPLYYHNAVLFERYGFGYQKGRALMERIHRGFSPHGDLLPRLDGSNPFRQPQAAHSVRLRSWAIHDGILGVPFTGVTMYKRVGQRSRTLTCPLDLPW